MDANWDLPLCPHCAEWNQAELGWPISKRSNLARPWPSGSISRASHLEFLAPCRRLLNCSSRTGRQPTNSNCSEVNVPIGHSKSVYVANATFVEALVMAPSSIFPFMHGASVMLCWWVVVAKRIPYCSRNCARRFQAGQLICMNLINGSIGYLPPADLYDFDVYPGLANTVRPRWTGTNSRIHDTGDPRCPLLRVELLHGVLPVLHTPFTE